MKYSLQTFSMKPLQSNGTLLTRLENNKSILIDPGGEAPKIISLLKQNNSDVGMIWLTHAHYDHISALQEVMDYLRDEKDQIPPIYLHFADKPMYDNVDVQSQMFGLPPFEVPKEILEITEGQTYPEFPELKVLHVPGHSPGSCCLYVDAICDLHPGDALRLKNVQEAKVLVAGDTLFRRSIGRTDLWQSNTESLLTAIKTKIFSLDDDVVVIPGHGPLTTVGDEKHSNPFLQD